MKIKGIINRNTKLEKEIEEHIKEYENKNLYTIFSSKYIKELIKKTKNHVNKSQIYKLIKEWDEELLVPQEIGKYLEDLLENDKLTIGIHRTEVNDTIIDNIITDGLKNNGDLSSGAIEENPDLNKTVSFPKNILNAMISLKSSYKNSTGGFLLAFPSDIVDENGEIKDNDYFKINENIKGTTYIKSEYVLGYIDTKYGVMNYFPKEELLDKKNRYSR